MIEPVRSLPVFAATVNRTVPLPVPLSGWLSVSQAESLDAVHAQSLVVVTVSPPDPPDAFAP